MNYLELKTELDAGHPDTGAYDANNLLAADQLNTANRTVDRSVLTGDDLFTATVAAEFAALTDHKQAVWISFCSKDINPFASANVAFVQWVFGAGSATVTALAVIRTETKSRAFELDFGVVREGDVEYARTL